MDTRSKILTPEEARGRYTEYAIVLASFDVLTAARIRRLRELTAESCTVIAALTEVAGSLLPVGARAELAAALAIIDCVVVVSESPGEAFEELVAKAAAVLDERDRDRRHTAELMEHVQRRNGS